MVLLTFGIILVVLSVGIQYIDQGELLPTDLTGYAIFLGGLGVTLIIIGSILLPIVLGLGVTGALIGARS